MNSFFKKVALAVSISSFAVASYAQDDVIKVGMSNVDDVGTVFVVNEGGGLKDVASCTWTTNPGCSALEDITYDLKTGTNIVFFTLYNDIYTGCPMFFPCGKYAGKFYMTKNGKVVWNEAISVSNNTRGLKKIWAVVANVDRSGRVEIIKEDEMSRSTRESLSDLKTKLRNNF